MKKLVDPRSPATLFLADLCRMLPRSSTQMVSRLVGRYLAISDSRRRREIEARFRRLCELGGIKTDLSGLVRAFFEHQFMLTIAPYVLAEPSHGRWDNVRVEGFEGVRTALETGRGVVISALHFGSNLLPTKYLERMGTTVDYVRPSFMADYKSPKVRRMLGLEKDVLYVGETRGLASPIREAIRLLKQNHAIGIAFDGDQGGGEMDALVFGQKMPVRRGFLEIARLARSPMVFCLGFVDKGVYVARYFPACYFTDEQDGKKTTDDFIKLCMRQFEETLREFPECVVWSRPFCTAFPPA